MDLIRFGERVTERMEVELTRDSTPAWREIRSPPPTVPGELLALAAGLEGPLGCEVLGSLRAQTGQVRLRI